jgi:hypothetical protein
MESTQTIGKKGRYTGQNEIIRFRASIDLYERLKYVASEEELCLAGLVRKLVIDSLERFPRNNIAR